MKSVKVGDTYLQVTRSPRGQVIVSCRRKRLCVEELTQEEKDQAMNDSALWESYLDVCEERAILRARKLVKE